MQYLKNREMFISAHNITLNTQLNEREKILFLHLILQFLLNEIKNIFDNGHIKVIEKKGNKSIIEARIEILDNITLNQVSNGSMVIRESLTKLLNQINLFDFNISSRIEKKIIQESKSLLLN